MNSTNNQTNKPKALGNKPRQRFFVGESDSEDENEHQYSQHQSRSSLSGSETSEDSNVVVGFAPTAFLDDDSGLGMESGLEKEEKERAPEFSETSTNQILPLRAASVNSGNIPGNTDGHNKRNQRRRFNDFYQLTDEFLGSGAYASVQTCVQLSSGKEFAVKLVDRHEVGHTRSRILREVEIFEMCRGHPNFVQLVEVFYDRAKFYLVFEKMQGGPLLKHIQRKVCFTEQEASLVTRDIANALKFLHENGVAHRDLKPENVLCTADGDGLFPVKLCDLDLASKPNPRRNSRMLPNVESQPDLASPVGSAEFLAPEVVDAFHHDGIQYDRRCDQWSLGVLVYILLCGYPPFIGECDRENCGWAEGKPCNDCQESLFRRIQRGEFDFPEEEWANISQDAKELISHLLVKNARERYTAVDVLNHPWIRYAPETPLHHVASNLFRNDSARDVQQMNEHFNVMNRFAVARLSPRLEETIPSLNSTPEVEKCLTEALIASYLPGRVENFVATSDLDVQQNNYIFDESVTTFSNQSSDAAYDEVEEVPLLTEDPQEALKQMQTYAFDADDISTTVPLPQYMRQPPSVYLPGGMIYVPPPMSVTRAPMVYAQPPDFRYTSDGVPTSVYPNHFYHPPQYTASGFANFSPLPTFLPSYGYSNGPQATVNQPHHAKGNTGLDKFNQHRRSHQNSMTFARHDNRKQVGNYVPPNLSHRQLTSTPNQKVGTPLRAAMSGLGLQNCQGSSTRVHRPHSRETQVNV